MDGAIGLMGGGDMADGGGDMVDGGGVVEVVGGIDMVDGGIVGAIMDIGGDAMGDWAAERARKERKKNILKVICNGENY